MVKKPTEEQVPQLKSYCADTEYCQIVNLLRKPFETTEEGVEVLAQTVEELLKNTESPKSFRECGVSEEKWNKKINSIASDTVGDVCTSYNPKIVSEDDLLSILKASY
ncbi:Aldehyde-alcohol dehydrogenase [Entamoeba marina]